MDAAIIANSLMVPVYTSARKFLETNTIETSAPCRIDSGGTWDIKAMALPLERIGPITVNMALNLRARVKLTPFKDGWIRIRSQGFSGVEEHNIENLPFTTPFGIYLAALNYFGYHGLCIDILTDFPVKSALGGSSSALVALIKALSGLDTGAGRKRLTDIEILRLGYNIEDGVSGGGCGGQDQAAAVYGGVHRWKWAYGNGEIISEKELLLDNAGMRELSARILVAYSGQSHVSLDANRDYLKAFLSGRTRSGWIKANDIVNCFANAIKNMDWSRAASLLRDEMEVRREITPEALIPLTEKMMDNAEKEGCGARFAGAGAGGCVWALGEPDHINGLKHVWEKQLAPVEYAGVLDCAIDPDGVI